MLKVDPRKALVRHGDTVLGTHRSRARISVATDVRAEREGRVVRRYRNPPLRSCTQSDLLPRVESNRTSTLAARASSRRTAAAWRTKLVRHLH
jgi:hypothetical protein